MKRVRRRKRTKSRRRNLWPLLGLGALGLAAVWLGRRRPSPEPEVEEAPPPAPAASPGLSYEAPDDADLAWIPGPSGSLRILERHPNGRTAIVFVHGLGGRLELWNPVVSALGPGLHSIAVDLPGHGGSDAAADGDYSIPAVAAALGAVVEGLSLRSVVLVAHSLGASVALEYAARHPERVLGVLLVDPNGDQSQAAEKDRRAFLEVLRSDPAREFPWYFRQILHGAREEVAERVLESLEATGDEVLLAYMEKVADHSPLAALQSYGGPVLSVVSDLNVLPQALHRLHPELPVRRLYGASHWLMMDRPEEVLEVLWDFLDGVA